MYGKYYIDNIRRRRRRNADDVADNVLSDVRYRSNIRRHVGQRCSTSG